MGAKASSVVAWLALAVVIVVADNSMDDMEMVDDGAIVCKEGYVRLTVLNGA